MSRPIVPARFALAATLILAFAALLPIAAAAADRPAAKAAAATPAEKPAMKTTTGGLGAIGLPQYREPESYSVDLIVNAEGRDMTMKRFIDKGRIRTEISADGQDFVMIELGDDQGTSYMLMPSEKRAIKQSRTAMMEMASKAAPDAAKNVEKPQAEPDMKAEELGEETIDGRVVRKVRFDTGQGDAFGWFDKASGAPVRMEADTDGKKSVMEWKNFKVAPQPAKLYELPKGYEVMDMDEMMAKMKTMQGQPGMGALMSGMPGMGGGGVGGMAKGMASGMASNFGSTMGGNLGASLGGALGGPLGAIAGQYIGGKVGGMIGKKAADAVIPGK